MERKAPDRDTLRALLTRVQAATGPDRDLDRAIVLAFSESKTDIPFAAGILGIGGFSSSLDAAIRLAEQFGIVSEINRHPWDGQQEFYAVIPLRMPGENGRISVSGNKPAPTRPLAVLVSLFGNLVAKAELDEDGRVSPVAKMVALSQELDLP